jgi:hypothetical protein
MDPLLHCNAFLVTTFAAQLKYACWGGHDALHSIQLSLAINLVSAVAISLTSGVQFQESG